MIAVYVLAKKSLLSDHTALFDNQCSCPTMVSLKCSLILEFCVFHG